MTPRNNPCPCGSGKKYKRCCGTAPVQPGHRSQLIYDREARQAEKGPRIEAIESLLDTGGNTPRAILILRFEDWWDGGQYEQLMGQVEATLMGRYGAECPGEGCPLEVDEEDRGDGEYGG